MFNITLRPGEQLDGKSHKFTLMADATRKLKSSSSEYGDILCCVMTLLWWTDAKISFLPSPYDTQSKFRTSGSHDRTFQINGKPYSRTQPLSNDSPEQAKGPEVNESEHIRPSTVDPSANRRPGSDMASLDVTARPLTGGFADLSSTGVFSGPYHVSPSRIRPTTKFTSGTDFFAATSEIEKPATMFTTTFLNNGDVKQQVQSKSEQDFMDGFMSFADMNGTSVSVFDIEEIIKLVLGDDIPRWIIEIFVVMCRNKSTYRRVKVTDFK